jgi:opacity protein-like surface antigen
MKKPAALFALLALLAGPAMAQDNPAPAQETPAEQKPAKHAQRYTPRIELSGGFTYRKFYFPGGLTLGMQGWYASVDYNLFHRVGLYAEGSAAYKNRGLPGNTSIYTIMAGPRVYPLGHRKLTPFAHVLFGEGYYRNVIPSFGGFTGPVQRITASTWQAGGGVDFNLSKHVGIRAFEADYGTIKFFGNPIDRGSGRVSFGVVYRFGGK